jgi:hypothetical protein
VLEEEREDVEAMHPINKTVTATERRSDADGSDYLSPLPKFGYPVGRERVDQVPQEELAHLVGDEAAADREGVELLCTWRKKKKRGQRWLGMKKYIVRRILGI